MTMRACAKVCDVPREHLGDYQVLERRLAGRSVVEADFLRIGFFLRIVIEPDALFFLLPPALFSAFVVPPKLRPTVALFSLHLRNAAASFSGSMTLSPFIFSTNCATWD